MLKFFSISKKPSLVRNSLELNLTVANLELDLECRENLLTLMDWSKNLSTNVLATQLIAKIFGAWINFCFQIRGWICHLVGIFLYTLFRLFCSNSYIPENQDTIRSEIEFDGLKSHNKFQKEKKLAGSTGICCKDCCYATIFTEVNWFAMIRLK